MTEANTTITVDPAADAGSHVVANSPSHDIAIPAPGRAQIDAFEAHMLQQPQIEIPVQHRFAQQQGLYAREIVIPKDTLMTGRVHRHQHVSVMVRGDMTVLTDKGMERISGYHCWVCEPGTKRIGYAHEETVWLTVHHTQHMEPKGIEDVLCEPMHVKPSDSQLARDDFAAFLIEYQVNTAVMNAQVADTSDVIGFPSGDWPLELKPSGVHGLGLFATTAIKAGALIAPARIGKYRTPAGRYTNHAPSPNARMARQKHAGIYLAAARDIEKGEEVFIDYRAALAVTLEKEIPCQQ